MKQTIETFDFEMYAEPPYINDRLRIYDKGQDILLIIAIDGAGNQFKISKAILRRIIK